MPTPVQAYLEQHAEDSSFRESAPSNAGGMQAWSTMRQFGSLLLSTGSA